MKWKTNVSPRRFVPAAQIQITARSAARCFSLLFFFFFSCVCLSVFFVLQCVSCGGIIGSWLLSLQFSVKSRTVRKESLWADLHVHPVSLHKRTDHLSYCVFRPLTGCKDGWRDTSGKVKPKHVDRPPVAGCSIAHKPCLLHASGKRKTFLQMVSSEKTLY